jgi:hypothetical protein
MNKELTYENEKILRKELIDRISYNTWVEYKGESFLLFGYGCGRFSLIKSPVLSYTFGEAPLAKELKPYLYPMSRISKEELDELSRLTGNRAYFIVDEFANGLQIRTIDGVSMLADEMYKVFEYLKMKHYDYNGLIGMDLAIDATGKDVEKEPFWKSNTSF